MKKSRCVLWAGKCGNYSKCLEHRPIADIRIPESFSIDITFDLQHKFTNTFGKEVKRDASPWPEIKFYFPLCLRVKFHNSHCLRV
jgi:hypothetical protein